MQSNQLSDGVIIKITTTPISVFTLSLAVLHWSSHLLGRWVPLALVLWMPEEEGVYPSPQTVGTRSQLPGPEFPVGWGKNGGEGLGRLRLQVGWGSQAGKCISSSQAVLTHTPKPLSKQQLGSVLGQTTSPPSLPPSPTPHPLLCPQEPSGPPRTIRSGSLCLPLGKSLPPSGTQFPRLYNE